MISFISGLIAEILLKYCEHIIVKYMSKVTIIYSILGVLNIFITFVGQKITAEEIRNYMDHVLEHFDFKLMGDGNGTVSFFMSDTRNKDKLIVDIFRKPTATDTTIHCNSNHSVTQKLAAYRFLVNMKHQLPLSEENKKQEINSIYQIARNNSYTISIIIKLNNKIRTQNKI